MRRVYKYTSTYKLEDTLARRHRITQEEFDFLVDEIDSVDLYLDGENYTWDSDIPNVVGVSLIICTKEELERIIDIDIRLHYDLGGYSTADDITNEVLFDLHDCEQYGFATETIEYLFYHWRKSYLTEDDVFDKIKIHGVESLTQHEKDFLSTGVLNSPWFYQEI